MPQPQARTNRIAVADHRRFIAEAVAAVIGTMPGFEVTGVAATESALRALGVQRPDVVLVGVAAPFDAARTTVRLLRAELPTVEIVLLADALEPELVRFVLDQRLRGLLLTDLPASDIATCLEQVAHGRAVLPAGWQHVLAIPEPDPLDALSGRQIEVLELLAEGCSYKEIAARLFISVNTVKFHVRSVFSLLGVHNRMAAVRILTEPVAPTIHAAAGSDN